MAAGLADHRHPFEETNYWFRNISLYWCDYRESFGNVGAKKLGILASLLYEGSGLFSEMVLCLMSSIWSCVRLPVPYLDLCYPHTYLQDGGGRARGFRICNKSHCYAGI